MGLIVPIDILRTTLQASNFLLGEALNERASILAEDLRKLHLPEFSLGVERFPYESGMEFRVGVYRFGNRRFSIDNAKNPDTVRKSVEEMAGTGLDREDLLYLSQVCEIGHRSTPLLWLDDPILRADLSDPNKHLDTLNEVWWLARWKGLDPTSVEREAKIVAGSKKSVDWAFNVAPIWRVHLEVKRLVRSSADRVYGKKSYFYTGIRGDGRADRDNPSLKFRKSGAHELNVLAVTWFAEISSELEKQIEEYLERNASIDAILVWSFGDRRRGGWRTFLPRGRELGMKRIALEQILLPPDTEDHARIGVQQYPRPMADVLQEARAVDGWNG